MNGIWILVLLVLPFCTDALPSLRLGTLQSAGVEGILKCKGKPAVGVKVKLYDTDTGCSFRISTLDDLMDEGITDANGHFLLKGHETEITSIDPKLNVYHDCNDETIPCLKKFSIKIPKDYVSEGEQPKRIFKAGEFNLEGTFSGESRDCLN
ncbi:unnamed protein product [Anisakis simplex]|uniref:Transthyretin-like family protein n=1 Tax=Anisakis simplex TaxID=6269 RepID=A0A0M3K4K4_ANISI|nr:unnamed protein product [Anisakis simplex]